MKIQPTTFLKGIVLFLAFSFLSIDIAGIAAAITGDDLGSPFFLIILFATSVPFFYGLFQTVKLLNYIEQNKGFSELSIKALKRMKNCAIIATLFYIAGLPILYFIAQMGDAPGIAAIGFILVFISVVVATFTAVLELLVKNGVEIKSENDLTV